MTGGQPSSASGKIEDVCLALGVEKEHIHVINPIPKNHEENMNIMKQELMYKGVSVIIPRRECIVTATKRLKEQRKVK
jgi:indolepyruvate ferredoxin oxidoreductase alpha subunit